MSVTIRRKSSESGDVVRKIATETISALKLVVPVDKDRVEIAEPSVFADSMVLGVATTSGNNGDEIKVTTYGEIEDAFFNFPVNDLLYLGNNGTITNVAPSDPFHVSIGKSLGPGAIFIDIEQPIALC